MRRYGVMYFRLIRDIHGKPRWPDAWGTSNNLENLLRHAAGRCAIEHYKKAIVFDRKKQQTIYVLRRNDKSVSIEPIQGDLNV